MYGSPYVSLRGAGPPPNDGISRCGTAGGARGGSETVATEAKQDAREGGHRNMLDARQTPLLVVESFRKLTRWDGGIGAISLRPVPRRYDI